MTTSSSVPEFALEGGRLDALELILDGLLAPINGYCLPGDMPPTWPFEALLSVPAVLASQSRATATLVLTDPDGTPLARLRVSKYSNVSDEACFLAGQLEALQPAEHSPARDIRLAAVDLQGRQVVFFGASIDPADLVRVAVAHSDAEITLVAASWNSGSHTHETSAAIATLRKCSRELAGSTVRFLALGEVNPTTDAASMLEHVISAHRPASVQNYFQQHPNTDPTFPQGNHRGCVILFSGLSGSGKSTVARALHERLSSQHGKKSALLDGDDVRRVLSPSLGFSITDREENLRRIGWVAARVASVGGIAICAPIAPFAKTRSEIRSMAEVVGRFLLIHVATPLAVCEQRDRKGLYARARAGEIKDFTGIDSPYQIPDDPNLTIDTSIDDLQLSVDSIMSLLEQ